MGVIPSDAKESRIEIIDLPTSSCVDGFQVRGESTAVEVSLLINLTFIIALSPTNIFSKFISLLIFFQLCGDQMQGKLFISVATWDSIRGSEAILIEVNENNPLEGRHCFSLGECSDILITSMSFSASQGLLAMGSESGIVQVFDLNSSSLMTSFKADACGVNQLRFDRKGHVLTGGNSGQQLKVWDLRTGTAVASRRYANAGVGFTAVCAHPATDIIFCGTNDGSVLSWDLRSKEECLCQEGVHSGAVTCLSMHPFYKGSVVSGSSDGCVVKTDFASQTNESFPNSYFYDVELLMREPSAITSIDVHSESKTLLASTAIGMNTYNYYNMLFITTQKIIVYNI